MYKRQALTVVAVVVITYWNEGNLELVAEQNRNLRKDAGYHRGGQKNRMTESIDRGGGWLRFDAGEAQTRTTTHERCSQKKVPSRRVSM